MLAKTQSPKILLVHNFYRQDAIGGEDLIFEQEKVGLQTLLGAHNVYTYTVSNDHLPLTLPLSLWFPLGHALRVYRLIRQEGIQLVQIHNTVPQLTPFIAWVAQKAGAKVVQTLHNFRPWCLAGTLYKPTNPLCRDCYLQKSFWPGVVQKCYRQSRLQSLLLGLAYTWYQWWSPLKYIDKFIVLSKTQLHLLNTLGISSERCALKYNGIPPTTVQPIAPEQKRGFIVVGRLEAAKGIELALEAFLQSGLDVPFIVIGNGPLLAPLQQRYRQPAIQFLGPLPYNETLEQIAQARYLIHPGLMQETFGLTLFDAMKVGTPVIGLNIGTRAEFIIPGRNGFQTEPSIEALSHGMLQAMQTENYAQLCQEARQYAGQFALKDMLDKQLQIYTQVLDAP